MSTVDKSLSRIVLGSIAGILGGYVVARRAQAMDWSRERARRDARA